MFDLYVLAMRKINSTLRSVWHVCIDYSKDQLYLGVCLTCVYWLYVRSTVTLLSVWHVCIDYTKDQLYLDVCLTCMYWLYVRSTVPWCLFDLYILTIRKINSTLMSVWPVCIGYTQDQQYLDVCLTTWKMNCTLVSVWPVCIGYR
jgi:hypothetical protein